MKLNEKELIILYRYIGEKYNNNISIDLQSKIKQYANELFEKPELLTNKEQELFDKTIKELFKKDNQHL